MSKKKPFVLRLQPEMMEALEKWSADEFRSVNGQLEWLIQRALKDTGRYKPPKGPAVDDSDNKKQ